MTQKQEGYEQLPHGLIADLKRDVEMLQKKLSQPDTKSRELILEIESMKDAVHQLNIIFEKALKEMKDEDYSKTFSNLTEKLNTVITQNETIAQGMVALSDKLDALAGGRPLARPMSAPPMGMPVQHSMGAPNMSGRMAPRPEMSMPSMPNMSSEPAGFSPAPPGPGSRKRLGVFL